MPFAFAVERSLRSCGRVAAAIAMCTWLEGPAGAALGLPRRPVTIEISAKPGLSRKQVGRFVVEGHGRRFADEFWVTVAFGRISGIPFEAQLASIPHELAHVGQWVRLFGDRTPWQVVEPDFTTAAVGLPSLAPWRRLDQEGGGPASPEALGRRLTDAFLLANPEHAEPACPATCPCAGSR